MGLLAFQNKWAGKNMKPEAAPNLSISPRHWLKNPREILEVELHVPVWEGMEKSP